MRRFAARPSIARLLSWICFLLVPVCVAFAVNTALVSAFTAQDARVASAGRPATAVFVLDDDSGTHCYGAACGRWLQIVCGQRVPLAGEPSMTLAVNNTAGAAACDGGAARE
jgi:hypothetical protein